MKDNCDCTKQEVCEPCDQTAQKTIDETTAYLADFITKRFPHGLPDDMLEMVTEIVLDAFHDGARWSEQTRADESRIISLT